MKLKLTILGPALLRHLPLQFIGIHRFASANTCPPEWVPSLAAVGSGDYIAARTTCTATCNANGYCCTQGDGGCNKVPCNEGCHIAFFTSDIAACYAECDRANDGSLNSCSYTHERHNDVGHLGFNPRWVNTGGESAVSKCVGSITCGCPVIVEGQQNWGTANECSSTACYRGCEYAEAQADMYNGENVPYDVRTGLDSHALSTAVRNLRDHLSGSTSMDAASIDIARDIITNNGPLLPTNFTLLESSLALIDEFEASPLHGPLFITTGDFARESTSDEKQLERAILQMQQSALDEIYQGTRSIFQTSERLYDSIIADCSSFLEGRKWQTAAYFPGEIQGPDANLFIEHTVTIDTTYPACWGRPVIFCKEIGIRATGLYLQAGKIAIVTIPQNVVDAGGFKIQVGASISNHNNKNTHKRNDRVTSTYDIRSGTVHIASPFGGGIYIRVPYLSDLGLVTITATGGIVRAPYFQLTQLHSTTEQEWMNDELRSAPAPWADIETDNFLLQVPRSWVYGYDYNHMLDLATNYTMSMNGVTDFLGFLPGESNREILYEQPDLDIKHGAYGVGSPQVNNIVASGAYGPQQSGGVGAGQAGHWLVTRPYSDETSFHELGHARLFTKYPGEEEAAVNLLTTYVQNVVFGVDLDEAFINSFIRTGLFTIDKAAINWMITENFRLGNEMDRSNTPLDEIRYQHRGFAKYPDVARLNSKGWGVWSDFWRQEHLDYMEGNDHDKYQIDDRTLRVSIAAGEDLTPLMHFWGVHPENPTALKASMVQNGLYPSTAVHNQLERYATIVPRNQDAFKTHFDEVHPGKRDCNCCADVRYGCGWYNDNYLLWDEQKANDTVAAVNNITLLYYPSQSSTTPTNSPTTNPSKQPTAATTSSPTMAPSKSPTNQPTEPQCLGKNEPCGGITPDPCCSSCNTKNGKCFRARRRFLREQQDSLDRELSIFSPIKSQSGTWSRGKRPVFSENGDPKGISRAKIYSNWKAARAKWNARTKGSYTFELERVSYERSEDYQGPFSIHVVRGEIVDIVNVKSGQGVPLVAAVELELTSIEQYFDKIELERNGDISYLNVVYNKFSGYPEQFAATHFTSEELTMEYIRNVKPE